MLRPFSDFKNFSLAARDGEIGKVKDLYFDDQTWTVRYVVVNTGNWLTGRKVLLSPQSFGMIDEKRSLIGVHLTKDQIENSPPIASDQPVSRQHEEDLHRHYGYAGYWLSPGAGVFGAMGPVAVVPHTEDEPPSDEPIGNPHLRSAGEVCSYSIHATDGDIGSVDNCVLDEDGWKIRYLLISRSWWPGKKVATSTEWIERVSWEKSQVFAPFTRDTIKGAPEWNGGPIGRDYEQRLHDYYGKRTYWPIES